MKHTHAPPIIFGHLPSPPANLRPPPPPAIISGQISGQSPRHSPTPIYSIHHTTRHHAPPPPPKLPPTPKGDFRLVLLAPSGIKCNNRLRVRWVAQLTKGAFGFSQLKVFGWLRSSFRVRLDWDLAPQVRFFGLGHLPSPPANLRPPLPLAIISGQISGQAPRHSPHSDLLDPPHHWPSCASTTSKITTNATLTTSAQG
nr:hypothetical protein [Tanacetum cinerariifolium]